VVTREEIRMRDENRCAKCGRGGSLHVHHRIRRSQGGQDTPENLITLCQECHRWAHTNPMAARRGGFLLPKHWDPAVIPVDHFLWPAGPVLLGADLDFQIWQSELDA